MNEYQKAIRRGIETGLDNHFFKKEPKKVWLTVDEAKDVVECVDACAFPSPFENFVSKTILLRDKLKKRIEQVEDEE